MWQNMKSNLILTGITKHQKSGAGFTLIELLVVIAIIGLLASVVLVSLNSTRKKARDTKRLADINQIQKALALYYDANGQYPPPVGDSSCGGWDTPADGNFLSVLKTSGYLTKDVLDPSINTNCQNYKYYRYGAGNDGCDATKGEYYVIGVVDMETSSGAHPDNPGFACSGRNWTGEFEWVTGQYEK